MQHRTDVVERVSPRGFGHRPALDGIRALAVTAVFMYHVSLTAREHGGFLGVSTFFTLSGFLITSLLIDEHEKQGRIDFSGFWSRRVRRLVPAAYLNLAFVLVLTVAVPGAWPRIGLFGDVLSVMLNVANWRFFAVGVEMPLRLVSPLVPQWSLAVEEQFYLVVPLIVAGVMSRRNSRLPLGIVFASMAIASVVLTRVISYDTATELAASTASRELYRTGVRVVELAAGALLAVALPRWALPRRWWVELLGWVGAAATAILWTTAHSEAPWLREGGLAIVAVASVLLIVGAIADGPLARALSVAPLVALGRISYGVYLFHWPIYLAVRPEERSWPPAVGIALVAVLTVMAAWASLVLVERPIRARRGSLTSVDWVLWMASATLILAAAWVLTP